MRPRPWLPRVKQLLGVLPDAEVARQAGVSQSTVTSARNALGTKPRGREDLDTVGADGTLKLVSAWHRAGKPMRQSLVTSKRLLALSRRFYGGWYQSVEAAGLKPEGTARSTAMPAARKQPLTEALLRGTKSSAELELLTGVSRNAIRHQRRRMGWVRDERRRTEGWLALVKPLLGRVSDAELASRAGVARNTLSGARRRLGIPKPPLPSEATRSGLREMLVAMPKAELRKLLANLDPIDVAV